MGAEACTLPTVERPLRVAEFDELLMTGLPSGAAAADLVACATDVEGRFRSMTRPGVRRLPRGVPVRCRPAVGRVHGVTVARSLLLFVLAALAEIGGAWLVWQGWREHRGLSWVAAGVLALGAYGFVATFQPDPNFGRILAAYGGVFVAGSLAWGGAGGRVPPDRWDVSGGRSACWVSR